MKKYIFIFTLLFSSCFLFADTKTTIMDAFKFSVERTDVTKTEQVFLTDIVYTPHKLISPVEIYIIGTKEMSFTEDQLASIFEYLTEDSWSYSQRDVLEKLGLPESNYEVVSLRRNKKDAYVLIKEISK